MTKQHCVCNILLTDSTCSAKKSDRCEDAREYYDFLQFKRTVKFHAHPTRSDPNQYPPFELVLSAKITYDQLSEKVGAALNADPTHLRFYTVNASTGAPRIAVKRLSTNQTLQSILNPTGYSALNQSHRNDALYFEVLDMSLAELDTKKNVKITWLSEGITKEVSGIEEVLQLPGYELIQCYRMSLIYWCPRMASLKMSSTVSSRRRRFQTRPKQAESESLR